MKEPLQNLAKRERQILEIVYRLGKASAAEVLEQLSDGPSYSTVRKVLAILEEKKQVKHIEQDRRYVYLPTRTKREARLTALRHLMNALFDNSAESVMSTLLDISNVEMSDADLRRLAKLIDTYRKERK